MEGLTKALLDELRLRGDGPVRSRAVVALAGLASGMGIGVLQGHKPAELKTVVVASAMMALQQADLYQGGPVLAHLRLALALMMIKQTGPIAQPLTAEQLQRWVAANGFWPAVQAELAVQLRGLQKAIATAEAEAEGKVVH